MRGEALRLVLVWAALAALLSLTVALTFAPIGAWRLPAGPVATVPGVKLRIMQPNIAQDAKFEPSNGAEILKGYLALSDRATSPQTPGLAQVTHLIWPESAFPFLLGREPVALSEIAAALPPNAVLITGAARSGEPLAGEGRRTFFNSIQAVNSDGAIVTIPTHGGEPVTLARPRANPTGIAVDERTIYWTTSESVASVRRDGGAAQTLVHGSIDGLSRDVVVGADAVYWPGSDAIMRLRLRPP